MIFVEMTRHNEICKNIKMKKENQKIGNKEDNVNNTILVS